MKSCHVCKTLVDEDEKFCTFCGNKFQTLSEFIDQKRDEVLFLNSNEELRINNIGIKLLSYEIEKFMKFKIGSFLVFILLFLCLIFGFYIQNEYKAYLDYQTIQKDLERNDYEKAQIDIDRFLNSYGESSHVGELIKIRNEISHEVDRILNEKMTKEYLSQFDKIGENVSMSGDEVLKLYNVANLMGMDKNKIEILDFNKIEDGHDCCKFVYGNHGFSAYYGENGDVVNVKNSMEEDIFNSGQVVKPINEFLVSDLEGYDIIRISKMIINLIHDDPRVSKFPNSIGEKYFWNITKSDNKIFVSSHVKYKNQNYENIVEDFQIILEKNSTGYKLIDLIFNGEKSEKIIY